MYASTRLSSRPSGSTVRRRFQISAAALLATTTACHDEQPDTLLAPSTLVADAAAGQWSVRANMPTDREATTTATITDAQGRTVLYAIGGRSPGHGLRSCSGGLSKVQAYHAATDRWTVRAPFPFPIQHTNGAGVIDGKIYVTGGCRAFKSYGSWTWMYDPAANTWVQKQSMPVITWAGHTGVIQNQLYVLSSCNGQADCGNHTNLYFGRYDPETDSWTSLPPPPSRFAHLFGGSAVIGGKFYVAGGWAMTTAVEIYDPATNQWTTGAEMGSPRELVASAAVGGKMYLIAGLREEPDPSTGEVRFVPVATTSRYDPQTDTWTNLKPAPRSGANLAAGRIVIGGSPGVALVGGAKPGNNHAFLP